MARLLHRDPTPEQIQAMIDTLTKLLNGQVVKVELTYRRASKQLRIQEVTAKEH